MLNGLTAAPLGSLIASEVSPGESAGDSEWTLLLAAAWAAITGKETDFTRVDMGRVT